MAAEHKLIIRTAAGVKVAEVVDYLWLTYRKQVNAPGLLRFALDGSHRVIPLLALDGQVEVWRRDLAVGLPWSIDFTGLFRGQEETSETRALESFVASCPGAPHYLARATILYPGGIANRSDFQAVKAETLLKTLVMTNCTSLATTANGRDVTWPLPGISVQADAAGGATLSRSNSRQPLLTELQAIAAIGGLDFDLVKVGPAAWEFRTYAGQRGMDRRATLIFDYARGNVGKIVYTYNRIDEATIAIVAGQGEGPERDIVVRTGPGYSAANHIEVLVDARATEQGGIAELQTKGDQALDERRAREQVALAVIQSATCVYGRDYALGDLARARYRGRAFDQKVDAVNVTVEPGKPEIVEPELRTI